MAHTIDTLKNAEAYKSEPRRSQFVIDRHNKYHTMRRQSPSSAFNFLPAIIASALLFLLLLCLQSPVSGNPINACTTNEASIKITIDTGNAFNGTSWKLAKINSSGDTSSEEMLAVSESPEFDVSSPNTYYQHEVCVEDGDIAYRCYKFTIYDTGTYEGVVYGRAWFRVKYKDKYIIEKYTDGVSTESPLFGEGCPSQSPSESFAPSISLVPTTSIQPSNKPTFQPSITSAPTITTAPTRNCDDEDIFQVRIVTDTFPHETSWSIIDVINNETVFESKRFEARDTIYLSKQHCVEKNGCHKFVIVDTYGDGIFCDKRVEAGYKFFYNGDIVGEGCDFKFSDEVLIGNGCASVSPSLSYSPSSSTAPSSRPSDDPSATRSVQPSTSAQPSLSFAPSVSTMPTMSPSMTPSLVTCKDDEVTVRVDLVTDQYPKETAWTIIDINENMSVMESITYHNAFTLFSSGNRCVNKSNCQYFEVKDSYGDGMYCVGQDEGLPSPGFKVYYDDIIILDGCMKPNVKSEKFNTFGYGCASDAPSISSAPSTRRSTLDLIAVYKNTNRRYFPERPPLESFIYPPIPNCTIDTIGCVVIPKTVFATSPDWAGKILQTSPVCDDTREVPCESGIPMSEKAVSYDLVPNVDFVGFLGNFQSLNSTIDTNMTSIAMTDFNGDGNQDIIVGNYGESNQVLFGNGDGTFKQPSDFGDAGTNTTSIAIHSELGIVVFGNDGQYSVGYRFGNSAEDAFSNKVQFDSNLSDGLDETMSVQALAVAHVGNDDLGDIIIFGNDGQRNQILLVLQSLEVVLSTLPGNETSTHAIATCDFDSDGYVDIVFGNYGQHNEILYGKGRGRFENPIILPGNEELTQALALGDLDADGLVDIVIGNDGQSNRVLINNGDRTFDEVFLPGIDTSTQTIALGDLNGDGLIDIAIGNKGSSDEVILNNRDWTSAPSIRLPATGFKTTTGILIADVDGDRRLDLLIGVNKAASMILLNNNDGGYLNAAALPDSKSRTTSLAMGDINNDGFIDVVVGNFGEKNQLLVNNGDGTFVARKDAFDGVIKNTVSIELGDLDNDGYEDLICGNGKGQASQIFMNKGNESGTFGNAIPLSRTLNMDTKAVALGDIDDDGNLDIVLVNDVNNGQVEIDIYSRELEGQYVVKTTINLPTNRTNILTRTDNTIASTLTIALGSFNGDNKLDVVLGIYGFGNYILLNRGNWTFGEPVELRGTHNSTRAIALADLDNDNHLDIVIGNDGQSNQVHFGNGDGTFRDPLQLPGGEGPTHSIALGDLDGSGWVDIVVGNDPGSSQAVINKGNRVFVTDTIVEDISGKFHTSDVKIADLDNDGRLDIVIGDHESNNWIVPYSSCPNGGARLHHHSWCFRCPSFMGRVAVSNGANEYSICKECIPDHTKDSNVEKCSDNPDSLKSRNFGENNSVQCPDGTFYNAKLDRNEHDEGTWEADRCGKCPPGEYSKDVVAIDQCFKCLPGEYQALSGASGCETCEKGTYQPERGKTECEACPVGGYCNNIDTSNGGFERCPPGTYNDEVGQSSDDACKSCPTGTFSFQVGANSSKVCEDCPYGTFNNELGRMQCKQCEAGTYQNETGKTVCNHCEWGYYTNKMGLSSCIKCPDRTNSTADGKSCASCANDFYLKLPYLPNISTIFSEPFSNCKECPPHAKCESNSTIHTLTIEKNHWRASSNTSKLYKCQKDVCKGSSPSLETRNAEHHDSDNLCKDDHEGPLCEVCSKGGHFFNPSGGCEQCTSVSIVIKRVLQLVLGLIVALIMVHFAIKRYPSILVVKSSLSLQAKFKILVSFYQVVSSLPIVYGARLDDNFKRMFMFFERFSLDIFDLFKFPQNCIGSMRARLVINTTWPYVLVVLIAAVLWFSSYLVHMVRVRKSKLEEKFDAFTFRQRLVYLTIVVFYFAVPTVSRNIFDAIKCKAFETNDDSNPKTDSYLVADMSIQCDDNEPDSKFRQLQRIFLVAFALWPVLTPIVFLALLMAVRRSVRAKKPTSLANALRFLWEDYDESVMFWDIVDTWRRLVLTGFIMFFDKNNGSEKIFRLALATIISSVYLGILAYARPYKRSDDFHLAFVSNLMLIIMFVLGIVLKLCEAGGDEDDASGTCNRFIGMSLDSKSSSMLVVLLSIGMFVFTIASLIIVAVAKIKTPKVYLVSTRYSPNLEKPPNCNFHVFMSHVWATGQYKTHAVARKLRLSLPTLKVWLDINNLRDVSKLEQSVNESAIFILYYSKGYFRSKNCRRELYAAYHFCKPIIVIYEGDSSVIEEMRDECCDYCVDGSVSNISLLQYLSNDVPIRWLNEGAFCAAVLNRIYTRLLHYLPYYQGTRKHLLKDGIKVPGEIPGSISLGRSLNILVCDYNPGALEVAEEIQNTFSGEKGAIVDIHSVGPSQDIITSRGDQRDGTGPTKDSILKASFIAAINDGNGDDISQDGSCSDDDGLSLDSNTQRPLTPISRMNGMDTNHPPVPNINYIPGTANQNSFIFDLSADSAGTGHTTGREYVEIVTTKTNSNHRRTSKAFVPTSRSRREQISVQWADDTERGNIENPTYDLSRYVAPTSSSGSTKSLFKTLRGTSNRNDKKQKPIPILLLYLNKELFSVDEGGNGNLSDIVQSAMELKIDIVLVHENDTTRGGCPFSQFFDQTPQYLIDPPFELYRDLAIPMYTTPEYRAVSLRKIMDKIAFIIAAREKGVRTPDISIHTDKRE